MSRAPALTTTRDIVTSIQHTPLKMQVWNLTCMPIQKQTLTSLVSISSFSPPCAHKYLTTCACPFRLATSRQDQPSCTRTDHTHSLTVAATWILKYAPKRHQARKLTNPQHTYSSVQARPGLDQFQAHPRLDHVRARFSQNLTDLTSVPHTFSHGRITVAQTTSNLGSLMAQMQQRLWAHMSTQSSRLALGCRCGQSMSCHVFAGLMYV
jgi:hypothetical protein